MVGGGIDGCSEGDFGWLMGDLESLGMDAFADLYGWSSLSLLMV